MPVNVAALRAELQNDPLALGYGPLRTAADDAGLAAKLNAVSTANQVPRGYVLAADVYEAIVPAEWAALAAQEKQRVQTLLSMGSVNASGANTAASFAAAFAAGTATRAALQALQNRAGSRAEVLFGAGVVVTPADCGAAR
jgi:hypothetical protein